jgi:hypothetical protein
MGGAPANPRKREFYVYLFSFRGYPFYVGHGRSSRAADRMRYVLSLPPAKLKGKSLSVRVMAELDKHGRVDKPEYVHVGLTKLKAMDLERETIEGLVRRGYLLTNWQHNPRRHTDTDKAVTAVLRKRISKIST